jgi:hypothetical protein
VTAAELRQLAGWVDQRLDNEHAGRQMVCEDVAARLRQLAAAVRAAAGRDDCGGRLADVLGVTAPVRGRSWGPPAPLPPRPRVPAGPGWAAATGCLCYHPVTPPRGMRAGILVRSSGPGWAWQNLTGGAWQGTVVIPGGRAGQLTCDAGDDGVASFAQPGGLTGFPAGDLPAGGPSDDGTDAPAVLFARSVAGVP